MNAAPPEYGANLTPLKTIVPQVVLRVVLPRDKLTVNFEVGVLPPAWGKMPPSGRLGPGHSYSNFSESVMFFPPWI